MPKKQIPMEISRKTWSCFFLVALLSVAIWYKFTYPQFSFIDLSVDRAKASQIARGYLTRERGVNVNQYKQATVFIGRRSADRYLQKALGFKNELKFLKKYNYELFFWRTRFFRENEKEQYYVTVSAATGEITAFIHDIKDTDSRPFQDEETAKEKAIKFLNEKFGFNIENHSPYANLARKYDNRTDYTFSWERKGVFIPWSPETDTGGAKLLSGVTIAGDEVLAFYKIDIEIPEQFNRYIQQKTNVGRNLAVLFRAVFFSLLTASIFFVVVRRNNLVMHTVKNFCLILTGVLFLFYLLRYLNGFESIMYRYRTTSSIISYLWRYISSLFMNVFIVTIAILMPCLSGESLRYEVFPDNKSASFLHYIISTIWSRNVFRLVILGYLTAIMMIGLQSAIFAVGQGRLGVWVEYTWMSQFSANYFPFLTSLVIGLSASFSEEITFRLFSISFGKKFFKNIFAAILFSSVVWGYGHSTYPVFPMWFRGLEVTILGFFLSFIYLRYGIISVIVAHYVFDVFWTSSAYLLGQSTPYLFYSALSVLLLPLGFGIIAYIMNRPEQERAMTWRLTKHQIYNLGILKNFLLQERLLDAKNGKELTVLKKEIISHGWDIAVVELAFEDILTKNMK